MVGEEFLTKSFLFVCSKFMKILSDLREEHIEKAYFFRIYRERLEEGLASQEILETIQEEILATTKLPMALDFLKGEIVLTGNIGEGMARLDHYFRPFQSFIMRQAEKVRSHFDQKIALHILQREAEYLSENPTPAGLFIFQFECIAHNHLGYDLGMNAMASDPMFDEDWADWILKTRLRLGTTDFADLVFYRSEHFVNEKRRRLRDDSYRPDHAILFGAQEGRIAKANRGKDPMFMFAALQRQLGHPSAPRPAPRTEKSIIHPVLEQRLQKIEMRLQLLEADAKGDFDLSKFYAKPEDEVENKS